MDRHERRRAARRPRGLGLTETDLAAIDLDSCVNDIAFVERASPRCEAADGPAPKMDLDAALAGFDAILRPSAAA